MNVTPELISRYADGAVTPEEARLVEEALRDDPSAATTLEEIRLVHESFGDFGASGDLEPEEASAALTERLYALRPVPTLERFEAVPVEAPAARPSRLNWFVAAAAVLLAAVGVQMLAHRPEVQLRDVTRFTLAADGSVTETSRAPARTVRTGDVIETAAHERLGFRAEDGSFVVLMPGARIEVGDPRDAELFELVRGTALCTVYERGEPRRIRAGGYVVHADGVDFGVRVAGPAVRAAGAGGAGAAVVVAVSRGRVEVGTNGDREVVAAAEILRFEDGRAAKSRAFGDPIYEALMARRSSEILPGYFDIESGVHRISRRAWDRARDGSHTLVVSDPSVVLEHLVLHVRAAAPTELLVTMVRPVADRPGLAETVTVRRPLQAGAQVVSVSVTEFTDPKTPRETMEIPASRSGLVRVRLRSADEDIAINVKASLWANRPPAPSEVIR